MQYKIYNARLFSQNSGDEISLDYVTTRVKKGTMNDNKIDYYIVFEDPNNSRYLVAEGFFDTAKVFHDIVKSPVGYMLDINQYEIVSTDTTENLENQKGDLNIEFCSAFKHYKDENDSFHQKIFESFPYLVGEYLDTRKYHDISKCDFYVLYFEAYNDKLGLIHVSSIEGNIITGNDGNTYKVVNNRCII